MELCGFGWKVVPIWKSLVLLKRTSMTPLRGLVILFLGILSRESRPCAHIRLQTGMLMTAFFFMITESEGKNPCVGRRMYKHVWSNGAMEYYPVMLREREGLIHAAMPMNLDS